MDYTIFAHAKVRLMLGALERAPQGPPRQKGTFSISTLENIVNMCDQLELPTVFKAIYLLAFFGFLHISNLVPLTRASFSVKVHLCRGMCFLS